MNVKTMPATLAAAAFLTLGGGASAQAPGANPAAATTDVRGTITAFDGMVLQVKDPTGKVLSVQVPDALNVTVATAFGMADIKPGMILGVTTLTGPGGTVVALDIHPLPPTTNVSTRPYDLAPGSQMTNGKLDAIIAVAGTNGTELTLNYGTGTVKALITPQTTMSQPARGARTDLKAGETIFARVRMDGDTMVATQLEVSKDGVKPGQ
jgi:hypothetical protein